MRSLFSAVLPCSFLVLSLALALSLASPASAAGTDIEGIRILENLLVHGRPSGVQLGMHDLTVDQVTSIFAKDSLSYLFSGAGESASLLAKLDTLMDDFADRSGQRPRLRAQVRQSAGPRIALETILTVAAKKLETFAENPFYARRPVARVLTHAAAGTLPFSFSGQLIWEPLSRLLAVAEVTLADPNRQSDELVEWILIVSAIGQMMTLPGYARYSEVAADLYDTGPWIRSSAFYGSEPWLRTTFSVRSWTAARPCCSTH